MDSPSSEIGTSELAKELRKLNLKRIPGEWTLYPDRWLIADLRATPFVAQTGTTKAKENAEFLAFLAGHTPTIIERLERLARLEKMIQELSAFGETVLSAAATFIQSDTPQDAERVSFERTSTERQLPRKERSQ